METDTFSDIENTFFCATLGKRYKNDEMPPFETMSSLTSVSALYLYSNPPPSGYGTPAPKVAETVLRAYGFNQKKDGKSIKISKYTIDNPLYEKKGDIKFEEVSSNWSAGDVHMMAQNFLRENFESISSTANDVIEEMLITNSDVLTKGNQTWDTTTDASLPCAQAYINFMSLMQENGCPDHMTIMEFLYHLFRLMGEEVFVDKRTRRCMNVGRSRRGNQVIKTERDSKINCTVQVSGEGVIHAVLDHVRSFCSYIKHGERAHLSRRAIASPSIAMRAFFLIIEEFHLKLGRRIHGSTISIGGEEKKSKIIRTMTTLREDGRFDCYLQSTQDATKWNECLNASCFGMMSKTFFDNSVRRFLGLPIMTQAEEIFGAVCMAGHFLLSIKRITLGPELKGSSEKYHGHIRFTNLEAHNNFTKSWLKNALPLIEDSKYLSASPGMLMGMHNAASTTLGLISVGYKKPIGSFISTLRSSDDSMTLYGADSSELLAQVIDNEYINLKMCGINLSKKKTLFFPSGYGEYTSWFQDGKMVSQFGPETTTLRPGGMNPSDDFHTMASSVYNGLLRLDSNIVGSEAKIRIGINNIRGLYRIKQKVDDERQGVRSKCLMLADGGRNPWSVSNCHLEETSIKKALSETQEEREYIYSVRCPGNPFSKETEEKVTWSKEFGTLVTEMIDTPRTLFHFSKRTNRRVLNTKGGGHAKEEKTCTKALSILMTADPTLNLQPKGTTIKMSDHVIECLRAQACSSTNSGFSKERLERAIHILKFGKDDEDSDEGKWFSE